MGLHAFFAEVDPYVCNWGGGSSTSGFLQVDSSWDLGVFGSDALKP